MTTTVFYQNDTLTTISPGEGIVLNTKTTWLEDNIAIEVDNVNLQSLTVTPTTSTQSFSNNYTISSSKLLMVSWWSASNLEKTLSPTLIAGNKYYYVYQYGTESQALSGTMNIESGIFTASTNYININTNCQIKTTSVKLLEHSYEGYSLDIYEYNEFDGYLPVTVNPIPSNYVVPTGTIQISGNGTYDVSAYASAEVDAGSSVNNQNKTITPTESQQTVSADNGYTGLGTVTVNAITATYVGSGVTQRTSSNLSATNATVYAPPGYYATTASKAVGAGSASTPATTITVTPGISVSNSGLITATASKTQNVTPTISAGYVSSGTAGTITVSGSNTQQLTTKAAATITPTTASQTIAAGTYLTGAQTIAGDANLISSNILSGKSIFGVSGSVVVPSYTNGDNVSY